MNKKLYIPWYITVIVILSIIFISFTSYRRGVYDTCVRLSAVNGQVTSFDLIQCEGMAERSEHEHWYGTPMPRRK